MHIEVADDTLAEFAGRPGGNKDANQRARRENTPTELANKRWKTGQRKETARREDQAAERAARSAFIGRNSAEVFSQHNHRLDHCIDQLPPCYMKHEFNGQQGEFSMSRTSE